MNDLPVLSFFDLHYIATPEIPQCRPLIDGQGWDLAIEIHPRDTIGGLFL